MGGSGVGTRTVGMMAPSLDAPERRGHFEIYGTDWSDCPLRFDLIEQLVLVRNLTQHPDHIHTLGIRHNAGSLKDRPILSSLTRVRSKPGARRAANAAFFA